MTFTYPATVLRIVDGDTLECDIDLGFRMHMRANVRLAGINAPEMDTVAGKGVKQYLVDHMPLPHKGTLVSHGLDKYGRALGDFTPMGAKETLSHHLLGVGIVAKA